MCGLCRGPQDITPLLFITQSQCPSHCPNLLSIAVIETLWPKVSCGRKSIRFILSFHLLHKGELGQELDQGRNHGQTLLSQLSCRTQPHPSPPCPLATVRCPPPTPIINQDNAPRDLPTDQSNEGLFSIEIFSSQMTQACPS